MPFGSNTKTYQLALPPGELPKPGEKLPARLVKNIPTADTPWWWSEYLMDEWKRKNGRVQPRENRTKWQQDHDRWEAEDRLASNPQLFQGTRGIPRHRIWGQA